MFDLNPALAVDFYKTGHIDQQPEGLTEVYSNFTARSAKHAGANQVLLEYYDNKIVVCGPQGAAQWLLRDFWKENFFGRNITVVDEYQDIMDNAMGPGVIKSDQLRDLHSLGYLPLVVKALPEGSRVDLKVTFFTIRNTLPGYAWLTNFLESQLSSVLFRSVNIATIANEFKFLLEGYAISTGAPLESVLYQAHDFSFRGIDLFSGGYANVGHLFSFTGTDTVLAIPHANKYYGGQEVTKAGGIVGQSVPATEHSIASSNIITTAHSRRILEAARTGKDDWQLVKFLSPGDEQERTYPFREREISDKEAFECAELLVFRKFITELYPTGIVSIVSDTYDFWYVLNEILPKLRTEILSRKNRGPVPAKVTLRPDCYDETTQIFTSTGWKFFNELNEDSLVAQVTEEESFEFVKPEKIVWERYEGKMVHFSDRRRKVDLLVTPNHRMVFKQSNKLKVQEAKDLKPGKYGKKFLRAAAIQTTIVKKLEALDKLKIAFQADGSYVTNMSSSIRFSFSKKRKIERLLSIVNECSLEYKIYNLKDNAKYQNHRSKVEIHIKIDSREFYKDLNWITKDKLSNPYWAQEAIEELSYWDATRRHDNRFKFDTTTESVANVVEDLCVFAGYGCLRSLREDRRKEHFSNIYTLNILKDSSIESRAVSKIETDYNGYVGCVKVPTGKVLVRRNNATLVSGNSGDPVEVICGKKIYDLDHIRNREKEIHEGVVKTEIAESLALGYENTNGKRGPNTITRTFLYHGKTYQMRVQLEWSRSGETYFNEYRSASCIEYWEHKINAEDIGAVEHLWNVFGGTTNAKGYKVVNSKVGLIYGDGITLSVAARILEGLAKKGFSSENIIFGVGSFTYAHNTRDTFGMAIKATHICLGEQQVPIFKDPATDSGVKRSARGYLRVEEEDGHFVQYEDQTLEQEGQGALRVIFKDGIVYNTDDLAVIRKRLEVANRRRLGLTS